MSFRKSWSHGTSFRHSISSPPHFHDNPQSQLCLIQDFNCFSFPKREEQGQVSRIKILSFHMSIFKVILGTSARGSNTNSQSEVALPALSRSFIPSSPQLSRFIIFKGISFLIFILMGFRLIQTPAVSCPCLLRAFNQRLCFFFGKRLFHGAKPKCPSQGLTCTH